MKKNFKIFLFILVLGATIYQFRSALPLWFLHARDGIIGIFTTAPCAEPIPYILGTFDAQFGISKDYFLSALADAEKIWEKPFGKDLFTYTPEDSRNDNLKINLIYDYRQQATSKLASLGIIVKDSKVSYDSLKIKWTTLKAEYDQGENALNSKIEILNQKIRVYEKEVNSWNKKGGAPQKEYDTLQATRLKLDQETEEVRAEQIRLNNMADEINALAVVLNRLATSLNLSVDKYNTINVSRGESFEEGVYSSDGENREIDIYEFSSREKLIRVLAHELGHALDLGHVEDPKAIMYKFNQGNNQTLTEADLEALKTKCGVK